MIRWYDWVFAFIAADFLIANAMLALFGTTFFLQCFGAFGVSLIWNLWADTYCSFRLEREKENGSN